ncbi:hypothetical protein [Herbaspirillum rubrisubalbicans]|uniref:hypothetical protein n=1 Tax=Herbaspirillum rubrisubalbicans TaxID=80842 RepID=UPI0015C577DC|nr:hypothetical protein [Herbaspirillum rubrisubalbicans]NQE48280.1 hypothetical protein [Herbaspirillum rubrisubalbicans]
MNMAIDTSLTSIGSSDPYGLPAGIVPSNPVKPSDNPEALAQAVALSTDASVIVTLGGGAASNAGLTYNAAGLFNSFVNAGTPVTTPDSTQTEATQSYYQGVLGSISSSSPNAGIYDGSGIFSGQSLSSPLSLVLKSNPDLTGSIVQDIVNQNVVGGLISTMA